MSTDIMKVRLSAEGIQGVVNDLKKVEGATKSVKKSSEGIGSGLRREFQDLGIAVALQQLASFVKANIDAQAGIQDLVETTGASAEAISVLGMAAKKEDVSMEALGKGIKGLTKFLGTLQSGSKDAADTLGTIGIAAKDLVGKSLDQQIVMIANALDKFSGEGQSGMNKSVVAMKVFGKSGLDMLQVMQQLSGDGFQKLQEEGIKTGQILSGEAALGAKEAKVRMAELQGQVTGLTNAFAQGLIPALGDAVNGLTGTANTSSLDGFKKLGEGVGAVAKGLTSAFIVVGHTVGYVINEIGERIRILIEDIKAAARLIGTLFSDPRNIGKAITTGDAAYKNRHSQAGNRFSAYTDGMGEALDNVWFGIDGVSAPTKSSKDKKKKNLGITNTDASTKAARDTAAEGIAAAKRELDAQKQTLAEFTALNEHYHDQEQIDLEDYLENRRLAIAYAGEIEIKALEAQIAAEKKLGKDQSATKIADLNAEIALKRQANAAALLEDTWKAEEDRKKARETDFSRAGSALDVSQGQLGLGLSGVDSQRAAGLISENEAIEQKLALYRQYLPLLEEEARLQLEIAETTGDAGKILEARENVAAVGELKLKFTELGDRMKWLKDTAKDAATSGLAEFFMSLGDSTTSLTDKIKALGRSIAQAVAQAAAQKMAASMMSSMSFAGGGPVFGAGTATSDSISARLSNGEFVMRAAAVERYGLGTMAALNGLKMPTRGYAEGGLVGGGAQPQTIRSEVSGTVGIVPPEGWELKILDSPKGVRLIGKAVAANPKRFNRALGRD